VVAVLPTGDEVRPVGTPTGPGEILDTNSLMLATQARDAGCAARCLPIEPDDADGLARAVRAAAADCDLLIIVAGSSAGRDDYTAAVVARLGTLAVHGVAVRPGHPVVLGVVDGTPVLGAPGYPVSAARAPAIPASPWRPRTSAPSAACWRCATGCATSPGATCSTRSPASTPCRMWTACSAGATCPWCGSCTVTRG